MAEEYVLTDLDLRVLSFLGDHGMKPEAEMARKLRIAPSTVNYKIRRLIDAGVIKGFVYRFNPDKLGPKRMAWCFFTIKKSGGMGFVKRTLLQHPNVYSILTISGDYDLLVKLFFNDFPEFDNFLVWAMDKLKEHIERKFAVIVLKKYKLHQIDLRDKKYSDEIKLTETDYAILRFISDNPTARIRDIAASLSLHRNTVSSRLKRLLSEKVILKKTAIIDPKYYYPLHMDFNVIVMIDVEAGKLKGVVSELIKEQNIHELTSISSPSDLLAVVRTQDTKKCLSFINNLYSINGVQKTRTTLIFEASTEQLKF